MLNTSQELEKLSAALTLAQKLFRPAPKEIDNPFFKSKYADLRSVWEVAREGLGANGLAVSQIPAIEDGKQILITRLMHSSGQFIEGRYLLLPVKNDPQSMGSAITYARRYSFCAMLGIVTDEDDDGNAASNKIDKAEDKKAPPKPTDKINVELSGQIMAASSLSDAVKLIEKHMKEYKSPHMRSSVYEANIETINKLSEIAGGKSAKAGEAQALWDRLQVTLDSPGDEK